ncbi:hypothetical protein Sste5346_001488 [Sporothrix stenoceras]|uniref:Zn(2)-C6 fungal-type domain-containing protein n=1 Tax=Sporothrix stenoceras TaxID=5173 RepID=A0ABR3ZQT0_9PEZI
MMALSPPLTPGRQPNLPSTTTPSQPSTQQGPTVLTFALNHRPRATRASVPKVRTGKRHVKCDEAKPSCSRCIKWQGFCEGYDQAAESASIEAAAAAASQLPATTTTAPTTAPARPRTTATPRTTPTTTPAGTPPGATKTPRNRNPATTCPNVNPNAAAKTARAPSTTSSSSATQGSRRTTPSSDVSASEYVHTTTAPPHTTPARTATPSIKREPDDDTPRAHYGDHPIFVGDDDSNASVIFMPREPIYVQTQEQRQFKREYDDEDDVEAEYYTHGEYAPDFVLAQRNTSTQPYFDLSLINGGTSSSFPLEPNYNSVMFASQWEKAYFDSWLTLAPNLGGGWFPSHLWTSTIPQLCRDEPAVRFAAIAIGAMAQAMSPALLGKSYHHMLGGNTTADDQSSQPGQPGQLGADGTIAAFPAAESVEASRVVPHYRNALTYYGHALRLLRLGGGGGTATSENNNGNQPQQAHTGNDPETPPSSEKERAAVLSCLLFVCFEALQGNREDALNHITHGLQIVDQFVARNLPPRALSEAQAYSPPDEASLLAGTDSDAEWQRRRQRQRQRDRQLGLLAAKQGEAPASTENPESHHRTTLSEDRPSDSLTRVLTRSPAPYVLEDEVMQVFRRLDFQAWSLGVFRLRRTRPADIKFQALDALNPATIPARFDSLDDARRWWDFVQHWILQFPRYMVAALQRYMDENPDAAERATAAGRMLDICDVPGAREIQREYLECLKRWYDAFYPLYEATHRQGGHPTYGHGGDPAAAAAAEAAYFRAASLKIPYILAWIGVSSLVYSDYEAMYQLTPQFRELNRLAALILPKQPRYAWSPFGGGASSIFGPPPGGATGGSVGSDGVRGDLFTMDNGPTMALFVVSCKCRVEAVRDESIRLLAAYPRRDGFWDSKILWAIADWNRVIEAENETEGSLYEQWLRLRQREAIFDETKPEVQMTAWVKNKESGKFEKLTQTVRWDR